VSKTRQSRSENPCRCAGLKRGVPPAEDDWVDEDLVLVDEVLPGEFAHDVCSAEQVVAAEGNRSRLAESPA
jgi:hypothetical protein